MPVVYLSAEEATWLQTLLNSQSNPQAEAIMQKLAAYPGPKATRPTLAFSVPEISLPDENETTPMLPLESIIVANIPGRGARLGKKLQVMLSSEVTYDGQTYPSPETLFATQSEFEVWVRERLSWLRAQPEANRERAVHLLRAYGTPKYGWLTWMKEHGSLPLRNSKSEVLFEPD